MSTVYENGYGTGIPLAASFIPGSAKQGALNANLLAGGDYSLPTYADLLAIPIDEAEGLKLDGITCGRRQLGMKVTITETTPFVTYQLVVDNYILLPDDASKIAELKKDTNWKVVTSGGNGKFLPAHIDVNYDPYTYLINDSVEFKGHVYVPQPTDDNDAANALWVGDHFIGAETEADGTKVISVPIKISNGISAVKLSTDNNGQLIVDNNVVANKFIGDGSLITNLPIITNTDALQEGVNNLYFRTNRVLNTSLPITSQTNPLTAAAIRTNVTTVGNTGTQLKVLLNYWSTVVMNAILDTYGNVTAPNRSINGSDSLVGALSILQAQIDAVNTTASALTTNVRNALAGTSGTPSATNKYLTDNDPRILSATTSGFVTAQSSVFTRFPYDGSAPVGFADAASLAAATTSNDTVRYNRSYSSINSAVNFNGLYIDGQQNYLEVVSNGILSLSSCFIFDLDIAIAGTGAKIQFKRGGTYMRGATLASSIIDAGCTLTLDGVRKIGNITGSGTLVLTGTCAYPNTVDSTVTIKDLRGVGNASSVRSLVVAANNTWSNGELQGVQPIGSQPSMRFADSAYRYEFMNGMSDTDGTKYVWVRTAKI